MPAQCIFQLNGQKTSMFVCQGFGAVIAFSGTDKYINKPDATAIVGNGPIPKGRYYIIKRESGGRLGHVRDFFADVWSNSHRESWFALYAADGKIDDWTFVKGVKRGHFRLHPAGRWKLSEGCITLTSQVQFDQLRRYLLAQPPTAIPGTDIRHYGTVQVL